MLNRLKIQNFTCFPKADLEFSKGLNVIVGENGTGKSHLLKLGYAVLFTVYELMQKNDKNIISGAELSEEDCGEFRVNLEKIFNIPSFDNLRSNLDLDENGFALDTFFSKNGNLSVHAGFLLQDINLPASHGVHLYFDILKFAFDEIKNSPIFYPAKEILSVYAGFGSSLRKRELDFDKTYLDFSDALGLKPLNEVNDKIKNSVSILERSINNYNVEMQNNYFYFRRINKDSKSQFSSDIPAKLFAEGHNKLGTLSYLMRNGSIQEGMTLFWDEPEANMNPKLLKVLAEVLVDMSSYMQIVLSTHSLFLLRELEILQEKKKLKNARYFGLHFKAKRDGVEVVQGDTSNDIGDITALDESLLQSQRYRATQYDK